MKNKLKKWPKNWVEHVSETCFFYFENKDILFIDLKILCSDKTDDAEIFGIRLTFKKYDKIYDIFINHEESTFVINYYYKDYYKVRKGMEQNFVFMMDTLLNGSDPIGLFNYSDLGGEASRDSLTTAYDISKLIEGTINSHSDRNDDDDNGEENNPTEPFSPYDIRKPEFLNC